MASEEESGLDKEFLSIVKDVDFEDPHKEYRIEIRRAILALNETAMLLGSLDMEMDENHNFEHLNDDAFCIMNSMINDAHLLGEMVADAHFTGWDEEDEDE